jgi:cytochrome c5
LHGTSIQDVVNVFLQDKLIGGGDVQGPMLEVNHDSLVYLDRTDLNNIVTYLKTVKSKIPPQPKQQLKGINLKAGENIFNQYCAGCHSTGAGGAPKIGDIAMWAPRIQLGMNVLYKNAITGIGAMPPKGTCTTCSDIEIQSAVEYIVSKSRPAPGTVVAPAATQIMDPTSLAQGKVIYDKVCTICHTNGQLGAPKLGDQTAWAPRIKKNMDVLIEHAIDGYKGMPPKGSCYDCSDADVIAAVKYMVQQGKSQGNYLLW